MSNVVNDRPQAVKERGCVPPSNCRVRSPASFVLRDTLLHPLTPPRVSRSLRPYVATDAGACAATTETEVSVAAVVPSNERD